MALKFFGASGHDLSEYVPIAVALTFGSMIDRIDSFERSLAASEPSPMEAPLLRAVWYGLHGDWEAAHELAQARDDADGAWVHAWLHRIEGDLGNADYWYRRAHRQPRRDDTRIEGLDIAKALIGADGGD